MRVIGSVEVGTVTDVLCDICQSSTRIESVLQFATLAARWGDGASHDGERYELHLCESCFFETHAYIRQQRRANRMFDNDYGPGEDHSLGLVATYDNFADDDSSM